MRVWDIQPGYLNRQSLLGEHREIHALVSIIENEKRGYAHHPETLRWKPHLGTLKLRHGQIVTEMTLRGYRHDSPVGESALGSWPDVYLDAPGAQFAILRHRYRDKDAGRIPLPETAQQLWAQHRRSVLARDPGFARQVELLLGQGPKALRFGALATELVARLRQPPDMEQLLRTLSQMRREGSDAQPIAGDERSDASATLTGILRMGQSSRAVLPCTALSDFAFWLGETGPGEGRRQ
jgi:hypothetical protein